MKELRFNHKKKYIWETFGVPDERVEEIRKTLMTAMKRAVISEKIKRRSEVWEYGLAKVDPKDEAELFVCGYLVGSLEMFVNQKREEGRPNITKEKLAKIKKYIIKTIEDDDDDGDEGDYEEVLKN